MVYTFCYIKHLGSILTFSVSIEDNVMGNPSANDNTPELKQTLIRCGIAPAEAEKMLTSVKGKLQHPTEEEIVRVIDDFARQLADQIGTYDENISSQKEVFTQKLSFYLVPWFVGLISSGSYDLLQFAFLQAKTWFMAVDDGSGEIEKSKELAAKNASAMRSQFSQTTLELLAERIDEVHDFRELLWADLRDKLKSDLDIGEHVGGALFFMIKQKLENQLVGKPGEKV